MGLRDKDSIILYPKSGNTWFQNLIAGMVYGVDPRFGPTVYPCHWAQHVDAWMKNPYRAHILIIKYEDLLREPVIELLRFCKFAGVSRENKHLSSIVEAAAFRNLRGREERIGLGRSDVNFPLGKFFFRRGEAGSHKDEMPPEVLEKFLGHAGETLRRCGYTIGEYSEDNSQQADESCEHLSSQGQ